MKMDKQHNTMLNSNTANHIFQFSSHVRYRMYVPNKQLLLQKYDTAASISDY